MRLNLIIALIFLSYYLAFPQIKGFNSIEPDKLMSQGITEQMQLNQLYAKEQMPVGNIVVPEKYFIGPNDILSIQINPIMPIEQYIAVTPDLKIFIPRIGIVDAKGKTLSEIEKDVQELVNERNPNAQLSFALRQPRMVLVTISGNVTIPGNYFLPASYQVSNAIKFAAQINPSSQINISQASAILRILEEQREQEKLLNESNFERGNSYASRNIKIFHSNGTSNVADLYKARVYNDPAYDPYLREGDVIFVPFEPLSYPRLSISGAVLKPLSVAYKNGDSASFLLKVGFGINEEADIENVKLNIPGISDNISLKIDKNMNLISRDYELKPGSSIIIGQKYNQSVATTAVVTIKGEINKPGAYNIETGKTRLTDIIEQAGDITSEAYLPLAYITRIGNIELSITDPRRDILQYFQYSDLTMEDTTRYVIDMTLKKPIVSCDFVTAYNNKSSDQNVLLQDGDVIIIPTKPKSVYVFGQVNNPGYVEFSEGKPMEWYIKKAGGYADYSEKDRARIIRGKNNVWLEGDEDVPVFAGDMIYVPRPPDVPKSVELQNYSILVSVLLGAISVISIAISIYNQLNRN